MTTLITIEQATKNDLKEILDLQLLCYQSEAIICNNFNIPPLLYDINDMYKEFNEKIFFKAIINQQIIGSIRGYAKGSTVYLEKLIVHPHFQHHGLGKRLISHFEHHFQTYQFIELFTGSKSKQNILFYQRSGYQIFKEQKINDDYGFVFFRKTIYQNK